MKFRLVANAVFEAENHTESFRVLGEYFMDLYKINNVGVSENKKLPTLFEIGMVKHNLGKSGAIIPTIFQEM